MTCISLPVIILVLKQRDIEKQDGKQDGPSIPDLGIPVGATYCTIPHLLAMAEQECLEGVVMLLVEPILHEGATQPKTVCKG